MIHEFQENVDILLSKDLKTFILKKKDDNDAMALCFFHINEYLNGCGVYNKEYLLSVIDLLNPSEIPDVWYALFQHARRSLVY